MVTFWENITNPNALLTKNFKGVGNVFFLKYFFLLQEFEGRMWLYYVGNYFPPFCRSAPVTLSILKSNNGMHFDYFFKKICEFSQLFP